MFAFSLVTFSGPQQNPNQPTNHYPFGVLLHTHNIRMCEIDIGNPKYTTFTKLVQVGNFITFEERETQSFYADCFYICPKPRLAPHLQTTGLTSAGPVSQPSRSDAGTQLTAFINSPKSSAFPGMTSFTSPGLISYQGIFILTSVNDTSSPRAREHLR